jgi:hypothetical protein
MGNRKHLGFSSSGLVGHPQGYVSAALAGDAPILLHTDARELAPLPCMVSRQIRVRKAGLNMAIPHRLDGNIAETERNTTLERVFNLPDRLWSYVAGSVKNRPVYRLCLSQRKPRGYLVGSIHRGCIARHATRD